MGGVKGPIGAAHLSLKRIGWQFDTPLVLKSAEGALISLTTVSPALLSYHLQVAWKQNLGLRAGAVVGAPVGAQIDATIARQVMENQTPRNRALTRAYLTQAVWSQARLYSYGYEISPYCPHCGAMDTLHHRIWECGFTSTLREEHFTGEDIIWIRSHPRAHELLQGLQILPYLPDDRPDGFGHEGLTDNKGVKHIESWTITGGPLEDFMHGVIFTDGTCYKPGPVTWNRAGWAILKLSEDGVVLAWARGPVGKLLPATSPAAENVAVLAAATLTSGVDEARSDYKALEGVEAQPLTRILSRTSLYAGVRRLIRGLAPRAFSVTHVPRHVSPDAADGP